MQADRHADLDRQTKWLQQPFYVC